MKIICTGNKNQTTLIYSKKHHLVYVHGRLKSMTAIVAAYSGFNQIIATGK